VGVCAGQRDARQGQAGIQAVSESACATPLRGLYSASWEGAIPPAQGGKRRVRRWCCEHSNFQKGGGALMPALSVRLGSLPLRWVALAGALAVQALLTTTAGNPVKRVVPEYPLEAAHAGIAGYVVLEYSVGPDGKVTECPSWRPGPGGCSSPRRSRPSNSGSLRRAVSLGAGSGWSSSCSK